MQQTPTANRLHIALFGRRNSGKSSLINALTGQDAALVSDTPGTTTDPVYKAMEIHPLGPCVLIDTPGMDDVGELGEMRVARTRDVLDQTDIAILVFAGDDLSAEQAWADLVRARGIPLLAVVNKTDALDGDALAAAVKETCGLDAVQVSAKTRAGIAEVLEALSRLIPADFELPSITGHLVSPQDVVLLVMPQDIQAPKGRLILPQVQTIRDLLDNRCIVLCVTTENMDAALSSLAKPPALIITDSQVFGTVWEKTPPESRLTSFSVLLARYKGDIDAFVAGADAIDRLTSSDRVLIAEACTHKPLDGDIARVKLPALLRKKVGQGLAIDVVGGRDFPADLSPYALVIHCGACMFNRRYVLSRVQSAAEQGVPITNYGVAIAKLTGILDKIQTR